MQTEKLEHMKIQRADEYEEWKQMKTLLFDVTTPFIYQDIRLLNYDEEILSSPLLSLIPLAHSSLSRQSDWPIR